MPLLWGKTRCTEVAGWDDRIATKLAVAGGMGAAVGSLLAVVQQQPLLRLTAASTASFIMLAGCFSVVQETSRLVRCNNSPTNSMLAGAATGALLFKSHGQSGAPGAVICALVGGAAHMLASKVEAAGGLQAFLISVDLLDPPPPPAAHPPDPQQQEPHAAQQQQPQSSAQQQQQQQQKTLGLLPAAAAAAAAAAAPPQQQEALSEPRPWWHKYLPIRKMSDEEWEEYKSKQSETQRKRIEAALAGGLPVMVERQQQQQSGACTDE